MTLKEFFDSLTAQEAGIIDHRLTVPDAIGEVLDEEGICDKNEGEDVADFLHQRNFNALRDKDEKVVKEVIADTIEGSTALADVDDEVANEKSQQWINAQYRIFESVADKTEKYVGRKLFRPF